MVGLKKSEYNVNESSRLVWPPTGVDLYYSDDSCCIANADCLEIVPLLEPGSVDLVLTDPPWGKSLANHARGKERRIDVYHIVNDEHRETAIEAWGECATERTNWPMIWFADPRHPWPGKWDQFLVWDKGPAVGGGGDVRRYWKQSWELIQVRRLGILCGKRDQAVLRFWVGPQDSKNHIAAKPISLITYLISKTNKQTILDPFMGSGTTLRAAKDLGRKAIGIEIEEKYCEIAAERLRQEVFEFA